MNVTAIGWVATVAFASSYLFRRPATLRKIQAAAAFLWVVYGLAIGAVPVVVANLAVAVAALVSLVRKCYRAQRGAEFER
ncbi:MAG: lactate dehydrogenase [Acidobacteria bacterium]|nr:MAG: lactate dehydrogenase [Acidobacteriota bacterium]